MKDAKETNGHTETNGKSSPEKMETSEVSIYWYFWWTIFWPLKLSLYKNTTTALKIVLLNLSITLKLCKVNTGLYLVSVFRS